MPKGGPQPRSGRPKGSINAYNRSWLQRELRKNAPHAVKVLVDIVKDEKAPRAERRRAADSLLDRAYGRARQAVDTHVSGDGLPAIFLPLKDDEDTEAS